MTKQHKWHKEIKAWADGATIESRHELEFCMSDWMVHPSPSWDNEEYEFRIKVITEGYRRFIRKYTRLDEFYVVTCLQSSSMTPTEEESDKYFVRWIDTEWQYERV